MIKHNAQLSSPKRPGSPSALRRKHKTQRKPKVPRVEGLLELFVMRIHTHKPSWADEDYLRRKKPQTNQALFVSH
ncbi:hypothetical protein TI24_13345 [Vibrio vulnificus]|uniref:Uncharacterized protein n=1 Tax=Vibrio vulnificus TaxID=672 RepID=A0A6S4Q1K2_VIBVL|nr:hypothetical protein VVCECT4999_07380 [Vibrio vulnificus]OJI30775.1 hypothetical protein VV99743_03315 [Vibrio vulnificus]PNG68264.1 hypothetical protein TI24_13345 [Vibrio vulnificus]PNG74330.1 hypothetical protein TI31_14550 [Vibrio vulnificus]POC41146.1 hypothetical protein CRN50_01970 [Vibrio vulnificus]